MQKKETKKFFDIKSTSPKNRCGLVVDLRKPRATSLRPLLSMARGKQPEEIDKNIILKELVKLEIQERNRMETLENKLPKDDFYKNNAIAPPNKTKQKKKIKGSFIFVFFGLLFFLAIPLFTFYQKAIASKNEIFKLTGSAVENVKQAGAHIANSDFEKSIQEFNSAELKFIEGAKRLDGLGAGVFKFFDWLPGVSLVPSAKQVMRAGEHLTGAARELTEVAGYFMNSDLNIYSDVKNNYNEEDISLIKVIVASKENLKVAQSKVTRAKLELELINKNFLKSDFGLQIKKLKEAISQIQIRLNKTDEYADALLKIFGNDYPKLYLFIFQNNQELRATGGFIGTYGLFKINNGQIEKVLVDGIYNPDGQLKEKIIPPFPLWKVSPNWGLRDANWFADFPTSAKKIVWFYEKTGGPTVDGVISFTPTVMEKLLEVLGPIEMPQYGITVTAENFVEVTQKQVELDYDTEENKPKQFLTDLTPVVLEKMFNAPKEKLPDIFKVFSKNIKEKHTMFYFLNEDLENLVLRENIGGALKDTPGDYLSIVNSNIDGLKTDGVIKNEIYHQARIQEDGSIIDTVTIKRTHNGGEEEYDWWNAENKNFLRVYAPKGSEFLEAIGFNKETPAPLLGVDYSEYKKDNLLAGIEETMIQDDKSGTWIFEETGKTVFANWVYTGPGKTSEVSFKYKLPFKVGDGLASDYSLITQKQAGAIGDRLFTELIIENNREVVWQYPELRKEDGRLKMESVLDTDKFYGVVLRRN